MKILKRVTDVLFRKHLTVWVPWVAHLVLNYHTCIQV